MLNQFTALPAVTAMRAFVRRLDGEKIAYKANEKERVVRIRYSGKHFSDVTFAFLFDEDGRGVSISVYSIAVFESNQLADALEFCNRVNEKYRWLRFYVDGDLELAAAMDAVIAVDNAADVCMELLQRSVNAVGAVCKELN